MYNQQHKNNDSGNQSEKKSSIKNLEIADNFAEKQESEPELTQLQVVADNYIDQKYPIQKKNNTGLPDQLKSGIENLSGYSMDDVKVHYNSDKPAQLQAHAYAQGNQIHLAPGQEKHLPHEAWHVVQQKQGRVKPTKQLKAKVNINDDESLEKEADVMGAKANQTSFDSANRANTGGFTAQRIFQLVLIQLGANAIDINNDMSAADIINLLGYTAPIGLGFAGGSFSEEISEADARKLFNILRNHEDADDDLNDLIDDLKDIGGIHDEASTEDESSSDESSSEDDDNGRELSINEQIDQTRMSDEDLEIHRLMKQKGFSMKDAIKIITAKEVQSLFSDWGGKSVYLSGGGAISLFTQQRPIEDLDFRINSKELDGDTSWYENSGGKWIPNKFLITLNDKISGEQFENVPKGKRPNATNTRTAGVDNFQGSKVEVSITIVSNNRETTQDPGIGINRLTKNDLLDDKLKTAISRNKVGDKYIEKVSKDIYDSLSVYVSIYGPGAINEEIIKGHLAKRSNDFRESNTEQNKAFVDQTTVNQLVERMFHRLIKTVELAAEHGNKLANLLDGQEHLTDAFESIYKTELEPEIDDLAGEWFRVERGGSVVPIATQVVYDEIVADFETNIQSMISEIEARINDEIVVNRTNPLEKFAGATTFPPEFLSDSEENE